MLLVSNFFHLVILKKRVGANLRDYLLKERRKIVKNGQRITIVTLLWGNFDRFSKSVQMRKSKV